MLVQLDPIQATSERQGHRPNFTVRYGCLLRGDVIYGQEWNDGVKSRTHTETQRKITHARHRAAPYAAWSTRSDSLVWHHHYIHCLLIYFTYSSSLHTESSRRVALRFSVNGTWSCYLRPTVAVTTPVCDRDCGAARVRMKSVYMRLDLASNLRWRRSSTSPAGTELTSSVDACADWRLHGTAESTNPATTRVSMK